MSSGAKATSALRTNLAAALRSVGLLAPIRGVLTSVQELTGLYGPQALLPWPSVDAQIRGVVARSPELGTLLHDAGPRRVLFVTPRGLHYDLVLQAAIAYRLLYDGVASEFLVCQNLPMCNVRDVQNESAAEPCPGCIGRNVEFLRCARLPYRLLEQLVSGAARRQHLELVSGLGLEQCRALTLDGYPVGQIVFPAVARYLLREDLAAEDPEVAGAVYRQFVFGGLQVLAALRTIVEERRPEAMVFVNGKLLWSAIAQAVCGRFGIRPVSYEDIGSRFMGRTWVFNSPRPIMDLDFTEPWRAYRDIPLAATDARRLDESLAARRRPGLYYEAMESECGRISAALSLERGARPIVLFTNVTWDTAALDKNTCFTGVRDWVLETVRRFAHSPRPLVVRTHPAEVKAFDGARSRELVEDAIRREFPVVPGNLRIVPSSSPISSYALLEMSQAAIVYTSTFGLESVLLGRPAVVAGRAHFAGKGFTHDPTTLDEYFDLVERTDKLEVTEQQLELARRYAYLFFFQLPQTIDLWTASEPHAVDRLRFRRIGDLRPGRMVDLDVVARGILGDGIFCRSR